MPADPRQPLAGVLVLDLTEGVAGPATSQTLGDLGAAVIKIERPQGDWGREMGARQPGGGGPNFQSLNRNKRDICLDLRHPDAREVAFRLIDQADVMITSYRPGVIERLGLGFDEVHRRRPELIYARISAFGPDGPLAGKPGSDTALQAASGLMSQIGEAGGPPQRVGVPVLDFVAARDAAIGILAALLTKSTGAVTPGPIDVNLFGSAAAVQTQVWQRYFDDGSLQQRAGSRNTGIAPAGTYRTADQYYLTVAVLREEHWLKFCAALELTELATDPRFATNVNRLAHRDELEAIVEPRFAAQTLSYWAQRLAEYDIIAAPVAQVSDIADDPDQLRAVPVLELPDGELRDRVRTIGMPLWLDGQPVVHQPIVAAPTRGEHTRAILAELSYSPDEIEQLLTSGASYD